MPELAQLARFLAAVRARLRLRQAAHDGAIGLPAAAVALLGILIAAGLLGRSRFWTPLAWTMSVAALVVAARAVVRTLLRWGSDEAVAKYVGEATGTGDLLLSAVTLERSLPSLEKEPVVSPVLVRALVTQAARAANGLDPRRIVDLKPAWRRLGAVAGAIALWAGAMALFPGLLARGVAAIAARDAALEASYEPILGDLELGLTFPTHTGLEPRSIPGTSGEVLAPPGTVVAFRARSLVPVETAELNIEDANGKVLETRPIQVNNGILGGEFTVKSPGGYRVAVNPPPSYAARPVREAEAHRIDIDPDRAPRVDLAAPADDLEVPGARKVELAYSADDDYGLGDLELVWRAATADAAPEQRKLVRKAGGKSASGKYEWDLADLDLKPGLRVAYHLEAKDNDDVSGPNVGSSRTLYVRIYSPAEKHEELLAHEQELVDHAVVLLADRIDGDGHVIQEIPADKEQEEWVALHGKTGAFLGELGRVAADLDKDPLAPKDLKPALAGIHDRLGRLDRDEDAALRELRNKRRKAAIGATALKPLRDGNPRQVAELERDTLLLDDLIGRQRLEELLSVADEMQRARDRLKGLLSEYKKTRSDALRKEIEREIRELERKMAELQAKASKLAGEIPDEFLNREAMGDSDMAKRLDAIKEMLARGDVDQAMAELQKLSQTLDKMVSGMEQDLRGFRGERFSAEDKALSELENRLADLEHDERQIQSETEAIHEAERQRTRDHLRDRVEPFTRRAREQVAQMKKKLAEVDPQAMAGWNKDALERARRRAEDLERALGANELDEAKMQAEQAGNELESLEASLREREQQGWEGRREQVKQARERVDEAGSIARQIAREMEGLFPKPGELLGPGDRKKLDELRDRQAATRRRLEEAKREVEKRSREAGEMAGEGLKQAGAHMQNAEGRLGEGDPRDSAAEEGQAAEQLSKLRKEVQRERRPRPDGGGSANGKETVKIPGADEYRGESDFRRAILDAMKREAPKDYKEQVKRYYEELAR